MDNRTTRSRPSSQLRTAQKRAVNFLYQRDAGLLLGDVGSGKTVIALTVIRALQQRDLATGCLVFAPLKVCQQVWDREAREWEHLAGMSIAVVAGKHAVVRRKLLLQKHDVYLLNYDAIPWVTQAFPRGLKHVDTIWFDELDKMKRHSTQRFKGRPGKDGHAGLRTWRKHFRRHYGMTGTPNSHHLLDLWAEVYCLDGGATFGPGYYQFRQEYFYQRDYAGYDWQPFPVAKDRIFQQLRPFTVRVAAEGLPPLVELPPRMIEFPPQFMRAYRQLERQFVLDTADGALTVESAGVLYNKLRQATSGFVYDDAGEPIRLDTSKFAELGSLISELNGQQAVVVYYYKEQQRELARRFPAMGFLGSGRAARQDRETIARFSSGELELLGLHPLSAGHGVDGLQKAGCRHLIMLTEPDTAGLYLQVIGRLRRTGQTADTVFVHRLHGAGTIDVFQDGRVHGGIAEVARLLRAVRQPAAA